MNRRYKTSEPWALVERLNICVEWTDALKDDKLGRTNYSPFGESVIYLASSIRHSPIKTRVLAHELGHALLQNGVAAYYKMADRGHSKSEDEADRFALTLLTQLYEEEFGRLPDKLEDIQMQYGL
ncbi:ImmA/IrrE family metallo-endopeptidase [Lacticaseibacillus songhuajiangensis]|uniref:ImmA/IrrE family metallo-endopeptidase n=1 Tax=Lacticaseibacillus songhuajiangensis TaxID=1296539 RepID=UPI000F7B46C1|nr:ImmA/IrrE family metallo-endopeptidase [Lacticaseibacillus songhuajiangensis]